jgi:hypothetical protein
MLLLAQKKSAASRDAAPSKYQNNVSNTNYYNSFVKHSVLNLTIQHSE